MTLTLWRGRELLGEIDLRGPQSGDQLAGILLISPTDPVLESVVQGHLPLPAGAVVMERSMADIVGAQPNSQPRHSGPIALQRVLPDQPLGIPTERQLRVEDDIGQDVPCTSIMLLEHRPDVSIPTAELAAVPTSARLSGSTWFVTLRLHAGVREQAG